MTLQHNIDDDFAPVTGGVDLAKYVRGSGVSFCDDAGHSDLDRHISRLLALHPDVRVAFRNQDLSKLDDPTKLAILDGINDLLGIRPLNLVAR